MTIDHLTGLLVEQVMRWRVAPDRYLKSNRSWIPRSRFQPTQNLNHAFQLLEEAQPEHYSMGSEKGGDVWVRVTISGALGEARDTSSAKAITMAIARALGLDVPGEAISALATKRTRRKEPL